MIEDVVLDSSTVSLLTQRPGKSTTGDACKQWLVEKLMQGVRIHLPEIVDYEVRRELIRANRNVNLKRLNELKGKLRFKPITPEAMLLAADLWAQARNARKQTAPNLALDIDVILAAQVLTLGLIQGDFVIATENVGHISRFAPAARWQDI